MPGFTQTPRSRGLISGLLIFLVGAWGGIGPLVGPYFDFGFRPGQAWPLGPGRWYLSVIPGAVAVLAGLIIMVTSRRGAGLFAALLAALAGAWFLTGQAALALLLPASAAPITAGLAIRGGTSGPLLATLGLFTGVGAVLLLFAGVAAGRFSMTALRDFTATEDDEYEQEAFAGQPRPLTLPGAGDPFATTDELRR